MTRINERVDFSAASRRAAVFFAALLCLWLLAYASHVHAIDTGDHPPSFVHACGFCASLSTGAGPQVAIPPIGNHRRHEAVDVDPESLDPHPAPAHRYLSRAPPAR